MNSRKKKTDQLIMIHTGPELRFPIPGNVVLVWQGFLTRDPRTPVGVQKCSVIYGGGGRWVTLNLLLFLPRNYDKNK